MQRAPQNHKLSQKKFKMMDGDGDDQAHEMKPKPRSPQAKRSVDLKKESTKETKASSASQVSDEVVSSPPALDIGKHITMIRGCASEKNL